MACQEFTVLYTHQKTKKSKVWQDGVLKANTGGNKATLFDDRGQCLESVFVKSQVKPGDDLESDRYLITVEAARVTENCGGEQPKKTEAPTLNRNSLKPTGLFVPHLPVGLKRKHTGFQGPRQVEKKMVPIEDDASVISPSSKRSHSSFPSQLYITSPLFSTTRKKDAETSLLLHSSHDACTNSNRETMSISSLASTSYIDLPKEVIHNKSQSISFSADMESNCQSVSSVAVSQSIRSKAQIIALLKSNPTQLCRVQKPSEITEYLSGCQPSESKGIVFNRKSELVSGDADYSGESTKQIHHQHMTEKTVSNNHWDIYMLPNSAERSCDEVTERKHGKIYNLGLELQDPYNPKVSQFATASMEPVEKGLKYSGMKLTKHKREYSWNCKTASQASASGRSDWETQASAINESSGKDQPNAYILSESNINKDSNIPFVSSSEDVYSRSTDDSSNFETNLHKSNEHSVTDVVRDSEVSSESQSEPLPRINSGSIVNEPKICGDVTWAGPGARNEDLTADGNVSEPTEQFMEINFNLLNAFDFDDTKDEVCGSNTLSQDSECLTKGAMAQKGEMRVHRNCEMMQRNEETLVKYSELLGQRDENQIRESLPLQLHDEICKGFDKIVKDVRTPPLIELACSEAENIVDGVNASPLNIETTENKTDLLMVNEKCSDFVHSRANNYESDTRNKFEKTEISYIPVTLKTSVIDKNPEKDVTQLEGANYQDSSLENLGASVDDIKPDSSLLALPLKTGNSDGLCQYIASKYPTAFDTLGEEHTHISRTATYPLAKGYSSSEKVEIGEIEFENVSTIMNSSHEVREIGRMQTDCSKNLIQNDNSLGLPELVNSITLLRSLTEHGTALESLQMMEDNSSVLYQRETTKEQNETSEGLQARQQIAEVSYSEDMQTPYLYFDSTELVQSSMNHEVDKSLPALLTGVPRQGAFGHEPKPVEFQGHQVQGSAASELMMRLPPSKLGWNQYPADVKHESLTQDNYLLSPKFSNSSILTGFIQSPGPKSLPEDDLNCLTENNFHKKFDFIEDPVTNAFSGMLNAEESSSDFNLRLTQWISWVPNKVFSVHQVPSLNPDSMLSPRKNEDCIIDIEDQKSLTSRCLPSTEENSACIFRIEKSCCSGDGNLQSTLQTRTPLITVPAAEEIPDSGVHSSVIECKEIQQSLSSSVAKFYDKPVVCLVTALEPEDRKYETSVPVDCSEKRQGRFIQPVFSNAASQNRQSKWMKYQNTAQCDLITQNRGDEKVTDYFCAKNVFGMPLAETRECQSDAMNKSLPESVHLQMIRGILGKHGRNFSSEDSVSERKTLSLHLNQIPIAEGAQKVLGQLTHHRVIGDTQDLSIYELSFPSGDKVKCTPLPKRQIFIPTVFQSHIHYKQIFTAALTEQLNIMLFELSQRLHRALSKVNTAFGASMKNGQEESNENFVPLCNHRCPAKLVMVKKEGQNKGRLFYTCDAPKADQCKFFKWIEEVKPGQLESGHRLELHDIKSIAVYLRRQKISIYEECQLLVRRPFDVQKRHSKLNKLMIANAKFDGDSKSKLYLKLSKKEHSSLYSKDDLWVVSKTLNFDSLDTFIACSAFFGPSSSNEVELLPLKGYSPLNWCSNMIVHALLVCNASTELTALRNMQEYFSPATVPLIKCLLKMPFRAEHASRVNKRKFIPPALNTKSTTCGLLSPEVTLELARKMIQTFHLNTDQATALIQIAQMMVLHENDAERENQQALPITIIHGVFGAGKSYLLSVVVLFLVQLFESSEASEGLRPTPWKLLIASSTNVAVDRVLLGVLDLGFEDFIRVGSVRKIAKPILPYSLHAGLGSENEQLKELLALMKRDLTPVEKIYVRKSIEHHKLGTNKAILQQVRVVGATCAACPFPCMNNLKFPVVLLDECSQMTEPTSLLPIARFECEKLVLVGDPQQLPPTIPGSEGAHENGLEQTLFDRLCLMGHNPVLLRTQYRCHPAISAVVNDLFYDGNLLDGITEMDRSPLLDWLPTLCFFNVNGTEQIERDNSFYNMAEVYFISKLIQSLTASGIEGSMIGVITLYKSQMFKIYNVLSSIHSDALEIKAVQVSTVDAFQGAEKEIIVLSCVRTRQVGFIDSEKRMNVALTRGKRHLLIVGNLACLSKNKLWGCVIHHCEGRENGLQHVSQYEERLNIILKYYLEKKKEEEKNRQKREIKKSFTE